MKLFLIALALVTNYVALGNPGLTDLFGLGNGLGLGHGLAGLSGLGLGHGYGGLGLLGHGYGGLGLGHGYGGHGMYNDLYNDPIIKQLLAFQMLKKWEDEVIKRITDVAAGVCAADPNSPDCIEEIDGILSNYARQIMMISQMSSHNGLGHGLGHGFGGFGMNLHL